MYYHLVRVLIIDFMQILILIVARNMYVYVDSSYVVHTYI